MSSWEAASLTLQAWFCKDELDSLLKPNMVSIFETYQWGHQPFISMHQAQ
jgi:hypothetical protein